MRQMAPPELTAPSAILLNTTTGQILYARNEHERRAPASLVKLVTAYVALRLGRLDKGIRVADDDLRVTSAAGMQNGELLSLRDLLFLLLVPSDNAASMTIARGLAGDMQTYVAWMNELASSWNLADTHFANPHGLDNKAAYSSAYDMAIIAINAMRDPTLADIVRQYETIAAGRRLESTNKLLNTYSGAIGVKTGTTDRAGECIIAMVDRPTGRALAVLMGSQDRFTDARLLLDYFYTNNAELRIDLPATPQNRYVDEAHNWREFRLREPLTMLISPWQVGLVSFYRRIDTVRADPNPNEPVGALVVQLGGRPLTEVPIYVR
jgi:D-alanyl-D-alanine carboxypeptidase (penicillin-binding protein 5/6)